MLRNIMHLVSRFWTSIFAKPLSESEASWVEDRLTTELSELWAQLGVEDQRHLFGVARKADDLLSQNHNSEREDAVIAALFHDSGKLLSGFSTLERVLATLYWGLLPSRLQMERSFHTGEEALEAVKLGDVQNSSFRLRLELYRMHPLIGGALLRQAGAPELAISWAEQHHSNENSWTIDQDVANILKDCDDD